MLWLGDHKGTFVLFHFYLILFYFIYSIAIKIWSRANASYFGQNKSISNEGRTYIFQLSLVKDFSLLWLLDSAQWGYFPEESLILLAYLPGIMSTSLSCLLLSCFCKKMKFHWCPRFILIRNVYEIQSIYKLHFNNANHPHVYMLSLVLNFFHF